MDVWKKCQGIKQIKPLKHKVWRIVEGQHTGSGTRKLVNTLEEHELLEEQLERSKPTVPKNEEFQGLHYLLSTEFRYPPLEWGSRFGTRLERSIWYGSVELRTALAEKAFYQLLFYKGVQEKMHATTSRKTAYAAEIDTSKGVSLDAQPFNAYKNLISQKESYEHSQLLGTRMREAAVQAFSYDAARSEGGVNIGVFTPSAFANKSPHSRSYQNWDCYNDGIHVEFTNTTGLKQQQYAFEQEDYWVHGAFPFDHEST